MDDAHTSAIFGGGKKGAEKVIPIGLRRGAKAQVRLHLVWGG